jgi:divalent metal cation (Fe/Co/Zn/Cd) transporter
MAADGTTMVVVAALGANALIAVSKFVAASITGSASMLSEALHSVADTTNQGLLLFGMRRARQPADVRHPFGYSKELYFWSFVVASPV